MSVCIDASLLIRWLVPRQSDPRSYELVDDWLEDGVELVGPALLFSEAVSVLRHQVHRGILEADDADRCVWMVLQLGIRRIDNATLYRRAYEIASHFGHPRAYDAQYIAAAEQEGCSLWTADDGLFDSVRRELPNVKHVSR